MWRLALHIDNSRSGGTVLAEITAAVAGVSPALWKNSSFAAGTAASAGRALHFRVTSRRDLTHYLSERPEMSSQRREVTEGQNNERKFGKMKNRNTQLTAIMFVSLVCACAVIGGAGPAMRWPPPATRPEAVESPVITIHSTDNVTRGKTGSFVLNMNPLHAWWNVRKLLRQRHSCGRS